MTARRKRREIDVIDVNRLWGVHVGSRSGGAYLIGTVRHADYRLARQAASEQWPDTRIGFLEERDG